MFLIIGLAMEIGHQIHATPTMLLILLPDPLHKFIQADGLQYMPSWTILGCGIWGLRTWRIGIWVRNFISESMMLILTLPRSALHQKTSYYAVSIQVSLSHCCLFHELYPVWSLSWTHFQFTGIFDPSNVPAPAPGPLTRLWLGNLIEWQLVFKF